jgi:hypothetical protein
MKTLRSGWRRKIIWCETTKKNMLGMVNKILELHPINLQIYYGPTLGV